MSTVFGIFIMATLVFFLIGYLQYEKNEFGCGTLFYCMGLIPLYCIVGTFTKEHCSYEVFNILKYCITGGFCIVVIVLIANAIRDNALYKKEEERRRKEERKKPLIININITSTTKEE